VTGKLVGYKGCHACGRVEGCGLRMTSSSLGGSRGLFQTQWSLDSSCHRAWWGTCPLV
jgi:hypothetical protein